MSESSARSFSTASVNAVPAPPPGNSVEDFHQRLSAIRDQASANAERSQRILDRAFDYSKDRTDKSAKPREVRAGTVGAVLDLIDDVALIVNAQSSIVSELDRLA